MIPKNTQSLVIIGVAVLMILIMWLTGGGKKAVAPQNLAAPLPPPVTPADTTKVQDFKRAIQYLVAAGKLPTVRSDRRVFLDIRDLDKWIEERKEHS